MSAEHAATSLVPVLAAPRLPFRIRRIVGLLAFAFRASHRAFVIWARATVYWAMKRFDDARALASRAEETFREYHDEIHAAQVLLLEGGIRFDEGDISGARTVFEAVLPAVEQFEDEETLARLFANLCTCDIRLGDISRGRAHGVRAAALFARLGMDTEALRLFWSVAEAEASNRDVALEQLRETAAQFASVGMLGVAADVSVSIHCDCSSTTGGTILPEPRCQERCKSARLMPLPRCRQRRHSLTICGIA